MGTMPSHSKTEMSIWPPPLRPLQAVATAVVLLLGAAGWRRLREVLFPKALPLPREPQLRRKLRVAVIGAGVGGSALSRWLRDLYGEDLELTLVSDGPIGGRVQAVEAADKQVYEGGATLISELNAYMLGFMRRLGLKEFQKPDVPLGIFDGKSLLVCEADPLAAPLGLRQLATLQSLWRFLCRYSLSGLRRVKRLMWHSAAPDFSRLYRSLAQGEAFTTPEELLGVLGPSCVALTRESAANWLAAPAPAGGGLPAALIDELVTGGMRSNYGGQGCNSLHALVGLVSIAGGISSRCFGLRGGNQQVPRGLVASAAPERLLVGVTVRTVRRIEPDSHWELLLEEGASAEAMKGEGSPAVKGGYLIEGPFDLVVVAHPLERSCLSFEGLDEGPPKVPGSFRRCVAHFVNGILRRELFAAAGQVLTVASSSAPFYSIGLQFPINSSKLEAQKIADAALRGEPAVFKVFASEVLSEAQLDGIFERREGSAEVLDWYAYPEYIVPQKFAPFVLDGESGSLIYLNAIEQTASAMEMSAVSARNAVNLVRRFVDLRRGADVPMGGF